MTGFAEVKNELLALEKKLDVELWNAVGANRPKGEVAFMYNGLQQLRDIRQQQEGKRSCSTVPTSSAMSAPTLR